MSEVYVDNDVSAYGAKRRPAYQRLLDDLDAGRIDGVIVWHLDRLTRRPIELEQFFELVDRVGVQHLASVTGDVDLASQDARFMARVLGAAARKESDDKARRNRRKHVELAERGIPVGGTRPFGYDDDKITIRPGEAAVIRDAATRVLAGESVRSLVAEWNDTGVRASRGGRWTQAAITRILTSARIAGLRSHHSAVVAVGTWEPIIDRATWEQLRAVLAARAVGHTGPRGRRHLLSGLLFCGRCDQRMYPQVDPRRSLTYQCQSSPSKGGCGGMRIVAAPLEQLLLDGLFARAGAGRFAAPADDTDALLVEVAAIEARLDRLAVDHYTTGDLDDTRQFRAATVALTGQLDAARARLAANTRGRVLVDADTLAARWPDMAFDRRVATLAETIDKVTILPARPGLAKFDPDRVEVAWSGQAT